MVSGFLLFFIYTDGYKGYFKQSKEGFVCIIVCFFFFLLLLSLLSYLSFSSLFDVFYVFFHKFDFVSTLFVSFFCFFGLVFLFPFSNCFIFSFIIFSLLFSLLFNIIVYVYEYIVFYDLHIHTKSTLYICFPVTHHYYSLYVQNTRLARDLEVVQAAAFIFRATK